MNDYCIRLISHPGDLDEPAGGETLGEHPSGEGINETSSSSKSVEGKFDTTIYMYMYMRIDLN